MPRVKKILPQMSRKFFHLFIDQSVSSPAASVMPNVSAENLAR
jgi:hypothetical protein